jgi:DNA processing protein
MQHLSSTNKQFPESLKTIGTPPKELYIEGNLEPLLKRPRLAVIGSRKATPYGRAVTEQLVRGIAARGVVIVSGLAIGVDSIAHQATLEVHGQTIAVLPSGLDSIYPSSHYSLAKRIVKQNGVLVTEYPPKTTAFSSNFIARNRLIAGLSAAVLITEAAEKSGSLHTANFALEQGKDVLVVPGPITSPTSAGCNNLIKAGATPVTCVSDVLNALKVQLPILAETEVAADSQEEFAILAQLKEGINDGDDLLAKSGLGATVFQQTLSMLEITGRIENVGGNKWVIR